MGHNRHSPWQKSLEPKPVLPHVTRSKSGLGGFAEVPGGSQLGGGLEGETLKVSFCRRNSRVKIRTEKRQGCLGNPRRLR